MQVKIFCTSIIDDSLAGYGVILQYGQHHRDLTRCYCALPSSESLVMLAVVTGLEALKRPSSVIVTYTAGTLPQSLLNSPDLRDRWERLSGIHEVRWIRVEPGEGELVQRCEDLARRAFATFREACCVAGTSLLSWVDEACRRFYLPELTEMQIMTFQGVDEEGEAIWGEPVEMTIGDLKACQ